MPIHEAHFYSRHKDSIECTLCAHQCLIKPGRKGKCGVRQNIDDKLYSLVYGEVVAEHVDPIEKKPLFHVLPSSRSLSISTLGCNFHCYHCQNNSISQVAGFSADELRGRHTTPEEIVKKAVVSNCMSISYTYVEPTVFYEFAYDCAVEAAASSIKNVFVSNGYLSEAATRQISPYLDAINIDVKSFSNDFYRKYCGAKLEPVLECVKLMKELGIWVEVTTLVIPGLNDDEKGLTQTAEFLVSVDPMIPWHVTAFHPTYKMTDRPRTPAKTLERARKIGKSAGLHHVYEGNIPGSGGESSYCHHCHEMVIQRYGYSIIENRLLNGKCPDCATKIAGIWS